PLSKPIRLHALEQADQSHSWDPVERVPTTRAHRFETISPRRSTFSNRFSSTSGFSSTARSTRVWDKSFRRKFPTKGAEPQLRRRIPAKYARWILGLSPGNANGVFHISRGRIHKRFSCR